MQLPVKVNARATVTRPAGSRITIAGRRDRAPSTVMEEGSTELEAEASAVHMRRHGAGGW